MLSIVAETAEIALGEDAVFIKVIVLGVMAFIGLIWVYKHIKDH